MPRRIIKLFLENIVFWIEPAAMRLVRIEKGAWKGDQILAAGAWSVLDDQNYWKGDFTKCFFASNALMAEVKTCLFALTWAKQQHWKFLEIKSDCLVMIQMLQKGNEQHYEVTNVINDIKNLASNFAWCSIVKVSRNDVQQAQNAAKLCLISCT